MVAKLVSFGRNTLSSLRGRNFRLYFLGQGVSLTGGWMQAIAQSWLVLHLTGSPTALGVVAALQYGPSLFLGPYAGVLADRAPKRLLLAITQTSSGLVALALGLAVAADVAQPWMVYAMAAALGLINAIDHPTRQSLIYELTGPDDLVSAVGLTGTANNVARIVGPAIAGILIAGAGMAACFFINAASYAFVLAMLALMRSRDFHRHHAEVSGGLAEGLAYVRRTPVVRSALLMMALVGALTFEFSTTLPAFVRFTLKEDAAGLAMLMSSMGVGAALGGIVTAGRRGDGLDRLTLSALGFGAATAAVGATNRIGVAAAVMFFVGVFSARFVGLSNGILQLEAEPVMRNRVVALWSAAFLGSTFVGAPVLGWLAETAGPRWALVAGLVGGLLGAIVGLQGLRERSRQAAAEAALVDAA